MSNISVWHFDLLCMGACHVYWNGQQLYISRRVKVMEGLRIYMYKRPLRICIIIALYCCNFSFDQDCICGSFKFVYCFMKWVLRIWTQGFLFLGETKNWEPGMWPRFFIYNFYAIRRFLYGESDVILDLRKECKRSDLVSRPSEDCLPLITGAFNSLTGAACLLHSLGQNIAIRVWLQ